MLKQRRRPIQLEQLESRRVLAVTIDFEDVGSSLAPESFFNGPDPNGTQQSGPFGDTVVVGDFESQGAVFNNTHSLDFGSWSGWAYSNATDTTTPGFFNQHSAISGSGAGGSSTYGMAFGTATIELPTSPTGLQFDSLMITNNTYAALSMRDGDSFAKQFGGPSGDDPDYLLLTIVGLDAAGASVGTVDFYLADYRFADNSLDYIVDTWTEVDVSSLAAATTLSFSWDSTDVGDFGINTPLYAAVDNIELVDSVVVDPVTISAGGPYAINEGEGLTLNGSASGTASPTYSWDINGDGIFGDAAGTNPNLSWQQLTGLGIDDGAAGGTDFSIALRVTDGATSLTDTAIVTLTNVAPSVSITGPSDALPGETISFQLMADDPSPADAVGAITFDIDWGDGSTQQLTATAVTVVSHTYAEPSAYTVSVTATDADDQTGPADTLSVTVQSIIDDGDGDVTITGSSGGDRIVIYSSNGTLTVRMNNLITSIAAAERIIVDGAGGNDYIVATSGLDIPVWLIGGAGNDYLAGGIADDTLDGGDGNDVLLTGEGDNLADGGSGSDRIEGRSGRDILFGGAGNDRINGGAGDDILSGQGDNDILFGNLGADVLLGGAGFDLLSGHFGNDLLFGGAAQDQLRGGADNDLIVGGDGADILRGEADDDALSGGTSAWEATLDAALSDLQTNGTPLPANILLTIDSWAIGNSLAEFFPFGGNTSLDALDGGSGTNTVIG